MSTREQCVVFACDGEQLLGVLHEPARADGTLGVVIVVGGPQYRVGSHRQFVALARCLSRAGFPTLRFDYRGMGDSDGEPRTFEEVEADIAAAVNALLYQCRSLRAVVLYGLCDAASAVAMYRPDDARILAKVLVNPWVRTAAGEARAYARHYFLARLGQRSFWTKVVSGGFNPFASAAGLARVVRQSLSRRAAADAGAAHFVERMRFGLDRYAGAILLQLSDRDLTAREFEGVCAGSPDWRQWTHSPRVTRNTVGGADHTFSDRKALDASAEALVQWLKALPGPGN